MSIIKPKFVEIEVQEQTDPEAALKANRIETDRREKIVVHHE